MYVLHCYVLMHLCVYIMTYIYKFILRPAVRNSYGAAKDGDNDGGGYGRHFDAGWQPARSSSLQLPQDGGWGLSRSRL